MSRFDMRRVQIDLSGTCDSCHQTVYAKIYRDIPILATAYEATGDLYCTCGGYATGKGPVLDC